MTTIHPSSLMAGPCATYNLADDFDLMGGSNGELQDLNDRLMYRTRPYGMNVCTEKSMVMTNSTNNISADISMNSKKLEEVSSFKYLGATLCKNGTCYQESVSGLPQQRQQWPD